MAPPIFTPEQEKIILADPIGQIVDHFRNQLPKDVDCAQYISSAASDASM